MTDDRRPYERPVELAECVHCNSVTVNPQDDRCGCGCGCGAELYPVARIVQPGTRISGVQLDAVVKPP